MMTVEDEWGDSPVVYDPVADRKARVARVVRVAQELGTRAAAARLGISKNTVTRYLQLSGKIEPSSLKLTVSRDGPRGFHANASGWVYRFVGKERHSVRFSCEVQALTLREVVEAVMHQAMATARKKAGLEE